MAEPTNIRIERAEDVANAGWAKETTLAQLATSGKASQDLLHLIAQRILRGDTELKKSIDAANKGLLDQIGQEGRANQTGNQETLKGVNKLTDAFRENAGTFGKTLVSAAKGLENFRIGGDENILKPLQYSLSDMGKSLGGTTTLLGKFSLGIAGALAVLSPVVDKIFEMNNMLRSMYGTGIIVTGGMEGLISGAQAAGLSTKEFSEILTKNANVTVALGTRRTTDLMKMFKDATRYGSEMIMTSKESQEAFTDVMSSMQTLGMLRNMSDTEIVNSSQKYLKEINALSQATGRNREEILKNTKAALQSPMAYTALQMLPKEMRENMQKTIAGFQANFDKEAGDRLSNEMAAFMLGGAGMMSKEGQQLLAVVPGLSDSFQELKTLQDAGLDTTEAQYRLMQRMNTVDANRLAALQRDPSTRAAGDLAVALQKGARQTLAKQEADAEEARLYPERKAQREAAERAEKARLERAQHAQNILNAATNNLKQTFDKIIIRLEPIIIPLLDTLAGALNIFSSAIETVTSGIKGFLTTIGIGDSTAGTTASVVVIASAVFAWMMKGKIFDSLKRMVVGSGPSAGVPPLDGAQPGAGGTGGRGILSKGVKAAGAIGRGVAGLARIGGFAGAAFEALSLFQGLGDIKKREESGEISAEQAKAERSKKYAGVAGTAIGAGAGAALGSIVPVIGTALGAAVGGWLGGWVGENFGDLINFDAIGSAIGTAWTATTDAVVSGVKAVGGGLYDAGAWVVDKIGGVFSAIGSGIKGAWNIASTAVSWVGDKVTGVFTGLGNGITTAWNTAGDAVSWVGNKISGGFNNLGTGLTTAWESVGAAGNWLVDNGKTLFGSIGTGLTTAWESVGTAGNWLVDNGKTLFGSIGTGLTTAWESVGTAGNWLVGKGSEVFTAISNGFTNSWSTVTSAGSWVVDKIGSIFGSIGSGFTNSGDSLDTASSAITEKTSAAISAITAGLSSSWEKISTVGDYIKETGATVFAAASDTVKAAWATLSTSLSQIGDTATALFATIGNAINLGFDTLKGVFGVVGSGITTTFTNFYTAVSTVYDTLTGVFTKITQGVSNLFDSIGKGLSDSFKRIVSYIPGLSWLLGNNEKPPGAAAQAGKTPDLAPPPPPVPAPIPATPLAPVTPTVTVPQQPVTPGNAAATAETPSDLSPTIVAGLTVDFYEKSLRNNLMMYEILKDLLDELRSSKDVNERGFSSVEDAVEKISGLVS